MLIGREGAYPAEFCRWPKGQGFLWLSGHAAWLFVVAMCRPGSLLLFPKAPGSKLPSPIREHMLGQRQKIKNIPNISHKDPSDSIIIRLLSFQPTWPTPHSLCLRRCCFTFQPLAHMAQCWLPVPTLFLVWVKSPSTSMSTPNHHTQSQLQILSPFLFTLSSFIFFFHFLLVVPSLSSPLLTSDETLQRLWIMISPVR